MSLADIVLITITKETQSPTRAGFGTPLILAVVTPFGAGTTVREYTDLKGLLADGFVATDPAHLAAAAVFSQSPRPPTVKIANRLLTHTQKFTITVDNVINDAEYKIQIGSLGTVAGLQDATFTSDATATADEITAGLKAAIDALGVGFTVTDNMDSSLTLEVASPGDLRDVIVDRGGNLSVFDVTLDPGIATDLAAVEAIDDDWFGLTIDSQSPLEVAAAAVFIEARKKIFGVSLYDSDVTDTGVSNDVLSLLQAASYARTYPIYHPLRLSYPAAAWMGVVFPKDPGSATWAFKTLVGIIVDPLTTTDQNTIQGKGGNVYVTIGGLNITLNGIMAGGEFIDITRGIDWLQSRMEERIFGVLVNADKIPFTDAGVATIEKEVRAQLTEAITAGFIAAEPEPVVTVPKVSTVSDANKTARLLPDVDFEATLAGAIHKVVITGRVTV